MADRSDEELRGEKGGASEAAHGIRYTAMPETDTGFWLKDRIRWGPVWAGTLVALAIQLILTALGVAIGLGSYTRTAVTAPGTVSSGLGIWTAISMLISLFVGGFVAARMAGIAGKANGAWNGVVVWALTLALGTLAVSLGASGLLGVASNLVGGGVTPGVTPGATNVTPGEAARAVRAVSSGAWWFLLWSILALVAAGIGGFVGARPEVVVTGQTTERAA